MLFGPLSFFMSHLKIPENMHEWCRYTYISYIHLQQKGMEKRNILMVDIYQSPWMRYLLGACFWWFDDGSVQRFELILSREMYVRWYPIGSMYDIFTYILPYRGVGHGWFHSILRGFLPPLVACKGYQQPLKGSRELTIPKRSPAELPGTSHFWVQNIKC